MGGGTMSGRRSLLTPTGARLWLIRNASIETLLLLVVATLGFAVGILTAPDYFPLILLSLPMVLASLSLGPGQLSWFVVFVLSVLTVCLTTQPTFTVRTAAAVGVIFAMGFIILLASFRRSRLGVGGFTGESMLVDLRDRILKQGAIPELPAGWTVESALRSAGGTPFAGDFVVASRSDDGRRLDLVLVDVSGKGESAGTRALLLSGAFGGLLAALPPEQFLTAANNFLLRQEWAEGFATAVHLSLDLETAQYRVWTAGHPPTAHYSHGSGAWSLVTTEGPILGLLPDAFFHGSEGHLAEGDGFLLYTDGLVETRGLAIDEGIDRLLGQADQILRGEFAGGAATLIDSSGGTNDDRALLVVQRS